MNYKIAKRDELKPNSMKIVEAGEKEILLVKTFNEEFFAVSPKCTHVGGPLNEGILHEDRIVCPWHHACFNCKNGEMIDPPALEDLETYKLSIEGNDLYVELYEKSFEVEEKPIDENIIDIETFIILGSGAAGLTAALTLRKEGFNGKIKMISKDEDIPYDRTTLSKSFMEDPKESEEIQLIGKEKFEKLNIELMLNSEVVSVDTLTKSITLETGKNIIYDKLLVATGGEPKEPYVRGTELENIFTLRSVRDSIEIVEKAKEKSKCVILGSSFIALETASRLVENDIDITVISKDSLPLENIFGEELGKVFLNAHKKKGVKFIFETGVKSFAGKNKVSSVELDNGDNIDTEMVVIGIGVKPAADFIRGVKNAKDGSIEVNEYLRAAQDVYVAGDIASFPDWRNGKKIRIEHWRTAMQQGKNAALNMLNKNIKYNSIPFFWTRQAGLNVQYVGYTDKWDEIIVDGDLEDKKFLMYFFVDNEVKAAAGSGKSKELAAIEELIKIKKMPVDKSFVGNSEIFFEILNNNSGVYQNEQV